jgi:hypothetical protein
MGVIGLNNSKKQEPVNLFVGTSKNLALLVFSLANFIFYLKEGEVNLWVTGCFRNPFLQTSYPLGF